MGYIQQPASGNVAVTSLPSLPAGSAVIGHVIVDSAGAVSVTSLPALPAGANVIGHVIVDSGAVTVTGTADVTDRAARLLGHVAVDSLPALPAGTSVIGHVIVDSAGSVAVTSLPALPAGANVIGHVVVDSVAGTVAVSGAVDVSDRPARLLGHVAVDSLPAVVQGAPGAAAWKVDGSAVTQPVSGTVTATLPTATNVIGTVYDAEGLAVRSGQMFLAGTGQLTLSLAGNARITLANPVGSGKTLNVYRLSVFSTAQGFAELLVNPTTGLPASAARPDNNLSLGNPTVGVGVLKGDTNTTTALGGGTDSGVALGFGANQREEIDFYPLMIVPAGVTVGFQIAFTGAATLTASLYWSES